MSAPEQHSNFEGYDQPRERSLPPIREVLGAELGNSRSIEDQQQQRSYVSVGRSSAWFPAGNFDNRPTSDPSHAYSPSRQGEYPQGSPAQTLTLASDNTQSSSNIPISNKSYSYGVLRTSGTSGRLTDAIPPSTYPQGIIRQTSHSAIEEHDLEANKRYKCDYCGKRFGMPSHLQIHLRTHTADKPFTCSLCNRSFTVKSNLTRHLKTHETK